MADLTDYQRDILIRTALGEARGEGVEGMADVIQTIFNRANSGDFPSDPAAAALQPSQYSTWNSGAGGNNPQQFSKNSAAYKSAERALNLVLSGNRPDYTGGAMFYHTPAVSPYWAPSVNRYGTIERNGHIYYPSRPVPPGEIPNVVASLQDTTPPPRVAPNPATISPDLSLMRNPTMSSAARMAQVTPPPPQSRPVSPMDIARAPGVTVATIPTNGRPGQSQIERITPMPSAREIAMAAGTTVATIPTTQRATLPSLPPPSNIGQPPITRSVPSVPFTLEPTAREIAQAPGVTIATIPTTPTAREIAAAPGTTVATIPTTTPGRGLSPSQIRTDNGQVRAVQPVASSVPVNARSRDSVAQAQLGQRTAAQLAPAFSQPAFVPDRLVPNPIPAPPSSVPLRQAPIQVVPSALPTPRLAPTPATMSTDLAMRRTPLVIPRGSAVTSAMLPAMHAAQIRGLPISQPPSVSPLRITVNGANSYSGALTPVQALQARGMTAAQAYDAANSSSRGSPSVEDRVRGETSSGDGNRLVAMELPPDLLAQLSGSFVRRGYRRG